MVEFIMEVAGRTASVRAEYESTKRFCSEFLCERTADFAVEISVDDLRFERERSARTDRLEGKAVRRVSDVYLETLALQRKLAEALFEHHTLLFHGSVVAVDGEGYLFTARSGTGKSTHTRLWREAFGDRAVMINDDKPFLRLEEERTLAYGSPWRGKHGLGTNGCAPLKAICILERGAKNKIRPISATETLPMLMQQSHRPGKAEHYPVYMELLDRLAGATAFYRLECNMEPQAAIVAYEAMASVKA